MRLAEPLWQERGNYCVFHRSVQALEKSTLIKGLPDLLQSDAGCTVALVKNLRYT